MCSINGIPVLWKVQKHICPVHGFLSASLGAHSQGMSHDMCREPTAQVAAAGKGQGMRGRHLAPLLPQRLPAVETGDGNQDIFPLRGNSCLGRQG